MDLVISVMGSLTPKGPKGVPQYINHRYLGPGNLINSGFPVDVADAIAEQHDLAYERIQNIKRHLDDALWDKQIQEADWTAVNDFLTAWAANPSDYWSLVGAAGLATKASLERFIGVKYPTKPDFGSISGMADALNFVGNWIGRRRDQTVAEKMNTWSKTNAAGEKIRGDHRASVSTESPAAAYARAGESAVFGKLNQIAQNLNNSRKPAMVTKYGEVSDQWFSAITNDHRVHIPSTVFDKFDQLSVAAARRGGSNIEIESKKAIAQSLREKYGAPDRYGSAPDDAASVDSSQRSIPSDIQEQINALNNSDFDAPMETDSSAEKRPSSGEDSDIPSKRVATTAPEQEATGASASVTTAVPAAAPAAVTATATSAAPVAAVAADNMAGTPPASGDPSGQLPFIPIESFMPRVRAEPDGNQYVTFGGSRIMYSWAYEFFPNTLPAMYNYAASTVDGVTVGHSIPWEWLPFYCSPQEFQSLPHGEQDVKIQQVRCRVTPLAKETQFTTAGATSGVVSNEHLCLGKVAIGLNKKFPSYIQARIKENSVITNATMSTDLSKLTAVDYGDLRKRYWGPLHNWTKDTQPYATPSTTSGSTVTNGTPLSCMEMNVREIETVSSILWDAYNATDQGKNNNYYGVPYVDRYVKRFPFMAAIGKPIVDEVFEPVDAYVSMVKHCAIFGASAPTSGNDWRGKYGKHPSSSLTNKNKISMIGASGESAVASFNCGNNPKNNYGNYHRPIAQPVLTHPESKLDQIEDVLQPSITIGMCPIKPIDATTSLGVPIQARAMWKIDYEITFCIEFTPERFNFPFATTYNGCTGMANPLAKQKNFGSICRWGRFPKRALIPRSWNTAAGYTNMAEREAPQPETWMNSASMGHAIASDADPETTGTTIGGTGFTDNVQASGIDFTSS